jgi:hypothetical protein
MPAGSRLGKNFGLWSPATDEAVLASRPASYRPMFELSLHGAPTFNV